jgi:hypothetical protein
MCATLKQKTVFKKAIENMECGNPKTAGEILLEAGYSPTISKNPKAVFGSKNFQDMLAKIDDRVIVAKWYNWALSDTDRRVSLEAGDKIMKLKNRYPKEQIDLEISKKRESLIEP